jgi:tetratricopeptide (TPR) repeat protein
MAEVIAPNAHLDEEERGASPDVPADVSPAVPAGRPSLRPRWWMAVAAAVLMAIVAVPLLLRRERDPLARLVALAPRSARIVEPRLTGGFAWAEYRGPVRSSGRAVGPELLKVAGEAGELVQRADAEKTANAQHAAGIALVLVEQPGEAMERLEAAAREKQDASSWSDLAAARYAAAEAAGRASLYPQALAAADAALRAQAAFPEALFNRALILARMGLTGEARKAWQRYLEVDPRSPWANEARERLRALPAAVPSSSFERDRPLIENAAAAGNAGRLRELVARHPQQARTWAEGEYLARWAGALTNGDAAAVAR